MHSLVACRGRKKKKTLEAVRPLFEMACHRLQKDRWTKQKKKKVDHRRRSENVSAEGGTFIGREGKQMSDGQVTPSFPNYSTQSAVTVPDFYFFVFPRRGGQTQPAE